MEPKEITIYDIAERLGLSPSTISKGLNKHQTISIKTQKKIAATAESMGYRFNTFAANLRKKKTQTIGVIVPHLNSSFMGKVIAGIEKIVNDHDYNLIISQSLESVAKEVRNTQTMLSNRVDGLLVSLSAETKEYNHFSVFAEKNIPVLFFDRVPVNQNFPCISINNELAGYQITKHLLEQGGRNIIHITKNLSTNVYAGRLAGYIRALEEFGIPSGNHHVLVNDLSENAGVEAALSVIELKGDSVFVANDTCAASCMNRIKQLGYKVPEDILFAGFNNDIISRNVFPPLTTIEYPGFLMGEMAAKALLDHLDKRVNIGLMENIIIKSTLMERRSTLR